MASVLSTFSPSFYPYHGRGNACQSWRKHTLGCLHLRWSSGKSGCGEGKELLPSPCFLPWHISTSAKQTFMDLWSFPALPSALSCPPVGTEGTLECKASTSCAQCFLQPPAPASVSPEFSLWHRGILSRLKSHSKTAHPHTAFHKPYLPQVQGWHPCFQDRWGAQASHCLGFQPGIC